MEDEERPPAELVAGKYRLTRLLGRGGMGSVWEGVHETLGNRVACKFIEPEFVDSDDAIDRFENEARAAASLKSKHVVNVYDHGVTDDGLPYIVMEYLEGEPLDSRIAKEGVLRLSEVATIIRQVSLGLTGAHQKGIVHRDLKPENVFLVWDEEDQKDVIKVVDFGIAKFTDAKASSISSATKTGSILGTPCYMSPEQARGLKHLDARSDNWSLGVIAYQALTGELPFNGEAIGDLLVHICTTDPTPPSELNPRLPAGVDAWMSKALNRDKDSRFQDVREMSDALMEVAALPHSSTLGSAARDKTVLASTGSATPIRTQAQGSPKATSGALTNAALETTIEPPPPTSWKSRTWGAIAVVGLVLGLGAKFLLADTGAPPTSQEGSADTTFPIEASPAEQDLQVPTERPSIDAPRPPPEVEDTPAPIRSDDGEEKKVEVKVEVPKVEKQVIPTPSAPIVKPRPRPARQTRPPAPRQKPRPQPIDSPPPKKKKIDLGY